MFSLLWVFFTVFNGIPLKGKTFLRPNLHVLGLRKGLSEEGTSQRRQVFTLSDKSLSLLVKAGHIALKWGEMLSAVTIVSQGE